MTRARGGSGGRHMYLVVAQHDQAAVDLRCALRLLGRARGDEVGFLAAVFLFGVLGLALADCFGRADDGRARCDGGDESEDHGGAVLLIMPLLVLGEKSSRGGNGQWWFVMGIGILIKLAGRVLYYNTHS